MKRFLLPVFLATLALIQSGCSQDTDSKNRVVLAQIDDRIITRDEYLARAELTVRPDYCRGKNATDKQIILNSLVAEKVLALAGEEDPVLTGNQSFQDYLRGIKEQAMRTKLLEQQVEQKIVISPQELRAAVDNAGKEYKAIFMFDESRNKVDFWKKAVTKSGDFEAVAEGIYGRGSVPLKEVVWGEFEESLESAIYNDSVTVGSLVGPVKTTIGFYLVKIIDLKRTISPGQASTDAVAGKVTNTLKAKKWRLAAANYVADMMQGKKIDLDPVGFKVLIEVYKPLYSKPDDIAELPGIESENMSKLIDQLSKEINQNLDQPLLTVDDEIWSIEDFIAVLRTRPLMFRAKNIKESEFSAYLKMAIKDILRDKYLTDDAYDKGLDNDVYVRDVEQQWRDHMLAIGKRTQLLQAAGLSENSSHNTSGVLLALQPELRKIAEKFKIEKQWPELLEINLTDIPWMALQSGNPYPQRVPPFPVLTEDARSEFLSGFTRE